MKKFLFVACLLFSVFSFAQTINNYQYVMVPAKFAFLKEADKFGLNTLTKGLLSKYGFVVYSDSDAIPDAVRNMACENLYADVLENNSFTNTKLTVVLKDCKDQVVFRSEEGKSREKDWRIAYNMALRDAFKSFDTLDYKYSGQPVTPAQPEVPAVQKSAAETVSAPVIATPAGKESLFAQPIANGFQLINTEPKVVMKLYSTSNKSVFIAEKGNTKGVLQNQNGNWVFEYYIDGKPQSETLYIKF